MRPLDGIKVVELTYYQNGPWGGVMLSDMGAEVIKIEDPVTGDPGRRVVFGQAPGKVNSYWETMNRNKRGITLDLKREEGREVFFTLAKSADIVIQNYRVGVVEKLGVDYEAVRKHNPRIIYASVSGFGHKGPDARDPVLDPLGQARGGLMYHASYPTDPPQTRGPGAMADQTGAIILAHGILLAIIARERYGIGQHVQVSQLGGQLVLQALAINQYLMGGVLNQITPRHDAGNPLINTYRCADGKWISLGCAQGDRFWPAICRALELDGLLEDPRFATMAARTEHRGELISILDGVFARRARGEWLPLLKRHDLFCTPVQSYAELVEDPQVVENEYLEALEHPVYGTLKQVGVPVKLSETPGAPLFVAPEHGQHTEEVLLEYGYTWERIEALREQGII